MVIFEFANDDIFYTNLSDNGYVYLNKNNVPVFKKTCNAICCNGNLLVCVCDDGIYADGKKVMESPNGIFLTADSGYIYFLNIDEKPQVDLYDYSGNLCQTVLQELSLQ